MATTEIKRGQFVYHDALFVDLGPGKRYTRASESELRALLLPRSSSHAIKDQISHYYEAQLIHYDLSQTKDKNLAKVRLTQALNSRALKVPAWIATMESELRKEWLAAIKRANNSTSAGGPVKKRKAVYDEDEQPSESSRSRKVKVMVEVDLDDRQYTTPSKRQKQTARKSKPPTTASKPSPAAKAPRASTPSPKKQQQYNPANYRLPNYDNPYHSDPATGPPPAYEAHDFTAPPTSSYQRSSPPPSINRNGRVQLSGTYHLTAHTPSTPHLTPAELIICLDKSTGHREPTLWAILHINSLRCILTTNNNDTSQTITAFLNGSCGTVSWRSEDLDTGEAMFRRGCEGEFGVDGQGWMRGVLWGLMDGEDVEIEGRMGVDVDMDDGGRWDVEGIREEWFALARRAYGRR